MSKPSSQHLPPRFSGQEKSGISRREFGRRAALAAALCITPGSPLIGDPRSSPTGPTAEQAKSAEQLSAGQAQEVEAKLANIVRKYGARLTEAQREHLRRILTYNEKMLDSVRSFSLENGDPPASVLRISFHRETTTTTTDSGLSVQDSQSEPRLQSQRETS